MKKIITTFFVALFAASTIFAAGVKRGGNADLSIYLNSSDTDMVSKDLVSQIVASPRISKFEDKNGRPAVVTIGKIKDETGEFFDTQILANSLKTAILNEGTLEFMANKDIRDAMRNEVASQADHAREEVAKETGIPAHLLTGATEEECKAQAAAIADYAKPSPYPAIKDAGEVNNVGKVTTRQQFAEWSNKVF